ncbi:hypothetical protein BKG60_24710 [Mycobacterium syngnathidarum]|uniref:Uncharacterized protein n=1 Tax=Mycobacterium syngnathidarum TaxID=1908205 RepID=A0A1Q9W565_9MYCO|nr:hypothetical protein BKG61_02420 [Mycobacterium syngnathidarum]OLT90188.1 hypothetical protein BKG60_24710 [Mycobacterium syngnathidarum]
MGLERQKPTWIHRRVERLVVEGTGECTRCVSLDFTLPADCRIEGSRGKVLVPIGIVRKGPLHGFSITGPSGKPVPLLGTEENTALSVKMISAIARRWGGEPRALEAFVKEAEKKIRQPADESHTGYVVGQEAQPQTEECTLRQKAVDAGFPHSVLFEENPEKSETVERFWQSVYGLLEWLRAGFLMATELDEEVVGTRSVLKFEYRESVKNSDTWTGRRRFDIAEFASAVSTHFELVAPPPLVMEDASVFEKTSTGEVECQWFAKRRATLHFVGATQARFSTAYVDLRFAPRRFGAYAAALYGPAALFVALACAVVLRTFRTETDTPPTGLPTLMLTAAGLLLSWVARAPEDWTTARILRRARGVLWLAATLCAVVAVFLAFPKLPPSEDGRTCWWWIFLVASLLLLVVAWFVHGRDPWLGLIGGVFAVLLLLVTVAVAPPRDLWQACMLYSLGEIAAVWIVVLATVKLKRHRKSLEHRESLKHQEATTRQLSGQTTTLGGTPSKKEMRDEGSSTLVEGEA